MNVSADHPIDREEVMAWLDEALLPQRAADVAAHIDGCENCRALANDLREVSSRLAMWTIEPAPPAIDARIASTPSMSGAELSTPRLPVPFWRRMPVWAIAVSAPIVLVAFLVSGRLASKREILSNAPRASIEGREPASSSARSKDTIAQGQMGESSAQAQPAAPGPMIVRTASIALTTDDFDASRSRIERITAEHGGHIASLEVSGSRPQPRTLTATLRIPSARLDTALASLRGAGRVQRESLGSEEVTDRYRDLTVRIANSKREEQRLVELLAQRTGSLKDVLAVEQEIARVRGEIERMESEERAMRGRVDLATVTIQLSENYRAEAALGPLPVRTRFRNALVDGTRGALEGLTETALAIVSVAPTILAWGAILFWPVRRLWRRALAGGSRPA